MTDAPTVDVAAAIAAAGDTPRPSDTIASAATAAPSPASGLLDNEHVAFDAALHQVDAYGNPKRTAAGRWAKKTGNGARVAQGKPIVGNLQRGASKKPAAVGEQPAAPPASAPSSSGSSFVPPGQTAGQAGAVDAVPVDEAPRLTPEECRTTAEAIVNGATGIAKMAKGDHWEPDDRERTQLVDSVSRVWSAYHLPRLGPVLELVMVLVSFIFRGEKRKGDMRALWGYLIGKKPPTLIAGVNAPDVVR